MTDGLVLFAVAVIVGSALPQTNSAAKVSVVVTAKALAQIDLLIASSSDIALADLAVCPGRSSYEMATTPIRLDALSGEPVVVVRAMGIGECAELMLAVRFELKDIFGRHVSVFQHDFGEVRLTADSPEARMRLSLDPLRRGV
jgi:hypothetical protein